MGDRLPGRRDQGGCRRARGPPCLSAPPAPRWRPAGGEDHGCPQGRRPGGGPGQGRCPGEPRTWAARGPGAARDPAGSGARPRSSAEQTGRVCPPSLRDTRPGPEGLRAAGARRVTRVPRSAARAAWRVGLAGLQPPPSWPRGRHTAAPLRRSEGGGPEGGRLGVLGPDLGGDMPAALSVPQPSPGPVGGAAGPTSGGPWGPSRRPASQPDTPLALSLRGVVCGMRRTM